jgi:hypothetical protein
MIEIDMRIIVLPTLILIVIAMEEEEMSMRPP